MPGYIQFGSNVKGREEPELLELFIKYHVSGKHVPVQGDQEVPKAIERPDEPYRWHFRNGIGFFHFQED